MKSLEDGLVNNFLRDGKIGLKDFVMIFTEQTLEISFVHIKIIKTVILENYPIILQNVEVVIQKVLML